MSNADILAKFLRLFPAYQEKIWRYSSNGDNSITVDCHDGQVLKFVYRNEGDWILSNKTTTTFMKEN